MEFKKKSNNVFYIDFRKKETPRVKNTQPVISLDLSHKIDVKKIEDMSSHFIGVFKTSFPRIVRDWEISGNSKNDFQWLSEVSLTKVGDQFVIKPQNHNRNVENLEIKFGLSGKSLPDNLFVKYAI